MCMCGDTACPSCGPAQGHDPAFERVLEALTELAMPDGDEEQEGCDKMVVALGRFLRIADLLFAVARGVEAKESEEQINRRLDAIRPCPKHGEWPDPQYGCVSCMAEEQKDEEYDC